MITAETKDALETQVAEALVEEVVRDPTGGKVCLTSSLQMEDMVVLHMLRQRQPEVPVIFLETGYHFQGRMRIATACCRSGGSTDQRDAGVDCRAA